MIYKLEAAANRGDPRAEYCLGKAYANGTGVERDLTKAEYWFRKSAAQGYERAQHALKELGN